MKQESSKETPESEPEVVHEEQPSKWTLISLKAPLTFCGITPLSLQIIQ
jgi:hypothetical protein